MSERLNNFGFNSLAKTGDDWRSVDVDGCANLDGNFFLHLKTTLEIFSAVHKQAHLSTVQPRHILALLVIDQERHFLVFVLALLHWSVIAVRLLDLLQFEVTLHVRNLSANVLWRFLRVSLWHLMALLSDH